MLSVCHGAGPNRHLQGRSPEGLQGFWCWVAVFDSHFRCSVWLGDRNWLGCRGENLSGPPPTANTRFADFRGSEAERPRRTLGRWAGSRPATSPRSSRNTCQELGAGGALWPWVCVLVFIATATEVRGTVASGRVLYFVCVTS